MQESKLRNLDHGDRDSLGLFQQRPSQGWGTPAQVQDPIYAANKFYDALIKIDGYRTGDINDVAQRVQRSGHPNGYRKHEPKARALASALMGYSEAAFTCCLRPGSAERETPGTHRPHAARSDRDGRGGEGVRGSVRRRVRSRVASTAATWTARPTTRAEPSMSSTAR